MRWRWAQPDSCRGPAPCRALPSHFLRLLSGRRGAGQRPKQDDDINDTRLEPCYQQKVKLAKCLYSPSASIRVQAPSVQVATSVINGSSAHMQSKSVGPHFDSGRYFTRQSLCQVPRPVSSLGSVLGASKWVDFSGRTAHAGISWAQARAARPVRAKAVAHIVDLMVRFGLLVCCAGDGPGLQSSQTLSLSNFDLLAGMRFV